MSKETQKALLKELKNPFDPKFVKWRVGATNADKTKGIALAYIDSREVMKRLDDVMGVGGWQDRYTPLDGGLICDLGLLIDGQWVWKSNAAGNTKMEAIKGGASDALKRAASVWGIGRYLYYLPNIWVPISPVGKSYALTEVPELPEWAKPGQVERWEDVAELEADATSGADDIDLVTTVIEGIDLVRAATNIEEFDKAIESLSADQKLLLVNEINTKKRELLHAGEIHTNSSKGPSA